MATVGQVDPRSSGERPGTFPINEDSCPQQGTANVVHRKAALDFSTPMIKLSFGRVLALFVVGSMLGLGVEIICHAVMYGGYENRYGLVWGPFSPMYGVGVVAFTLLLNRLWRLHSAVIFLLAMFLGSMLEYFTSWAMWHFFGATAWNYDNTFLNIGGRVNLMFAVMWGLFGLLWIRLFMPLIKRLFDAVKWDSTPIRASVVLLTAFLAVDVFLTVAAVDRESQRAVGAPAQTGFEVFLDQQFPTEWMQERFDNLTVYGLH